MVSKRLNLSLNVTELNSCEHQRNIYKQIEILKNIYEYEPEVIPQFRLMPCFKIKMAECGIIESYIRHRY